MGSPLRSPSLHSQLKFFKSCLCLMGPILSSFHPYHFFKQNNNNNIKTSHLSDTLEYIKVLYYPCRGIVGESFIPVSLLRLKFKVTQWLGIAPGVELGWESKDFDSLLSRSVQLCILYVLPSPVLCSLAFLPAWQHAEALLKVPGLNKRTDYF